MSWIMAIAFIGCGVALGMTLFAMYQHEVISKLSDELFNAMRRLNGWQ